MILITTYNRPEQLSILLDELPKGERIVVVDDGSEYDPTPFLDRCEYHRGEHIGKVYFWQTWDYLLKIAQDSDDDKFYFMPDDWQGYDFVRLDWIFDQFDSPFCFNYANFGMQRCWTPVRATPAKISGWDCIENGFVDCGFMTNRKTLELLDWTVDWVNPIRFQQSEEISSGVGEQLSRRLWKKFVPMYKPVISLCRKIGDVDVSQMHPEHRKKVQRPML